MPVEVLEAVTVRHYTSRAGDPHRHLHLQLGARVFAAGKWRGLHTVGIRDFLAAINGIGHAAVACDPQFRAALAAHGYTLDATGEILELAEYVGPFSARAAQIGRNLDRYERDWIAAHPGEQPGPALRRAWDARAWAEGRPDKVIPRSGADLVARWRAELAALGYRDPARPVALTPTPVGALDRDAAVDRVLTRLAAGRSAWNAADIRGEVERLIAAEGIVADAGGAPRVGRGPHRPRPGPVRAAAGPGRGCPSTSGPGPPGRCSTWRPTCAPGSPPAPVSHRWVHRGRRRCRPALSGAWTPGRPRRSPRWPATGSWWWWRVRPGRARPPRWPPPATCSSGRGDG